MVVGIGGRRSPGAAGGPRRGDRGWTYRPPLHGSPTRWPLHSNPRGDPPVSPPPLPSARLRALRSIDDAVRLFEDLGYTRPAHQVDTAELGLPDLAECLVGRSARGSRAGYGLVLAEAAALPRSLRPLARALQRRVHDRPLAVLGVPDEAGIWRRMIVLRPRHVSGQLGAVTLARLDIDLGHPTRHDAEVLNLLRWQPDLADAAAQDAVDNALDVERVTRAFYTGLVPHFQNLERAVNGVRTEVDEAV